MSSAIISALIGIIAALLGAWAGAAISRRSANDIMRKEEFNRAAAKLRSAFAPAQVQISIRKRLGNVKLREFFDDAFLIHAAAIEEFRPFASDAVAYQKAYENYRSALYEDDAHGNANFRWKTNVLISDEGEKFQDFIDHVNTLIGRILFFASY